MEVNRRRKLGARGKLYLPELARCSGDMSSELIATCAAAGHLQREVRS